MNLKKNVLKVANKRLEKLGYIFYKDESDSGFFPFYKKQHGFNVGLEITKARWTNELNPTIRVAKTLDTIDNLFYLTEGEPKYFCYTNEEELQSSLENIFNQFIFKGDKYLSDNDRFEEFDIESIYIEIVDKSMQKMGFSQTLIDDNLLVGGKAEYTKGNIKIGFHHGMRFPGLVPLLIWNDKQIYIFDLAIQKNMDDKISLTFLNKNEYIMSINSILNFLEHHVVKELDY